MIKVLNKAFQVLEAVVQSAPAPVGPKKLAEKLRLTVPTCSHILKMLLENGYVLQVSRQAGYVPGPKLLALHNMAEFEAPLLAAARPIVDSIARNLRDTVLLSRVYGSLRYVLYLKNGNPNRIIRVPRPGSPDLYATATGLAEMSYTPWQMQAERFRNTPAELRLPEAATEAKTRELFLKIRREGFFTTLKRDMGIFAVPVLANGSCIGTLGCNVPQSSYTQPRIRRICKILSGAAEELSSAISVHEI